jgi:hypothetical protein
VVNFDTWNEVQIISDSFTPDLGTTLGGIINIVSRNDNMGFVDLPKSGLLLNYHMLDHQVSGNQSSAPVDPRIPDMRNTLYWNPEVTLFEGNRGNIEFYTGDVPGNYEVWIRGYTALGGYFQKKWSFQVN